MPGWLLRELGQSRERALQIRLTGLLTHGIKCIYQNAGVSLAWFFSILPSPCGEDPRLRLAIWNAVRVRAVYADEDDNLDHLSAHPRKRSRSHSNRAEHTWLVRQSFATGRSYNYDFWCNEVGKKGLRRALLGAKIASLTRSSLE